MLQTAWAVIASQQYLFIYLLLLFLINITVNESFMPVVGQHPLSPFPYPRFYCWAWHHVLCKTLWPAQVIPQKTYNLLTVGAGGRRGTETKNLNNTCPATKQNLSNLWASTKGNYLHLNQTQCKQGRLAGLPQTCSQQPLSGWFWTLDSQTSNSLQQSEHKL